MRDGFIKVAAITPKIKVADCIYNSEIICRQIEEAYEHGAKILVFPELCITGYTCGDLFWQEQLLREAKKALYRILAETKGKKALVFVGLPWEVDGKLYNVAAACSDGQLLGLVPKRYLPSHSDYYEARNFYPGKEEAATLILPMETENGMEDTAVMFGMNQMFVCPEMDGLAVAAELGEDLWVPNPPSIRHALAGANVIVNLSASTEVTGKSDYRTSLVCGQSARLLCGYIYSSAGEGESTQDVVFGGHNLIAENGALLDSSSRFSSGILYGELDIHKLRAERRRMTTFESYGPADEKNNYVENVFSLEIEETKLTRKFGSVFSLFKTCLCGIKGIFQEHCDCHGTDTSGNGGDIGCLRLDLGKIHVSAKLSVFTAVDSDVDYNCAVLNHIGCKEIRLSDCGNKDISTAASGCQVFCS